MDRTGTSPHEGIFSADNTREVHWQERLFENQTGPAAPKMQRPACRRAALVPVRRNDKAIPAYARPGGALHIYLYRTSPERPLHSRRRTDANIGIRLY